MNYRERHEAEREKMRKRTRRNTRISMLVCVVAAGGFFVYRVFFAGAAAEDDNVSSQVSEVPSQTVSQVVHTETLPSDWNLILVSDQSLLPLDFLLPGLTEVSPGQKVDKRIVDTTKKMLADAKAAGVELQICSAYRTVKQQEELYLKEPAVAPGQPVAVQQPRASEHHTGLAIDIITPDFQRLEEGFENTEAFRWLDIHAWEYGFILRYPKDKQEITGVIYEPWHYRYVGMEHAKKIKEQKVCLEEYLQNYPNQG